MDYEKDLKAISEAIEGLEGKATELLAGLEKLDTADDSEAIEKAEAEKKAITDKLEELVSDKKALEDAAQKEALETEVKDMKAMFESARKTKTFTFNPATGDSADGADHNYGKDGKGSFYADVKAAKSGKHDANERIDAIAAEYTGDQKAMVENSDTAGGYLVPPEIADELIRLREANGVLRGLIPSHPISVDELRIGAVDNGLAVAWTAELTEKLQSEFKFSELSANVFTAAGLAIASNQLLKDNKFNLDQMINRDLAKRFIALEEQAFLNGSGVGQPLGIRQTAGVKSIPYPSAESSPTALIDTIITAITEIWSNFYGAPNAIVMHPRTWGYLVKARESGTPNSYILGAPSTIYGRQPEDSLPGFTAGASLPRGELFGLPVYTTPNVPTTLGSGTNESCVFVGNWGEALILDREGITTDQSEHVFFTSNQTVFRSEERVGFTAARYPKAFAVVEGAGLAGH